MQGLIGGGKIERWLDGQIKVREDKDEKEREEKRKGLI